MLVQRLIMTMVLSVFLLIQGCMASDEAQSSGEVCTEAADYFSECTGTLKLGMDESCDTTQASQLLETPCAALVQSLVLDLDTKADDGSKELGGFMCQWFNVGCPADESCLEPLSDAARADLVVLSDPETLVDHYDAQDRVNAIAAIFREEGDPRGLFATVYRLITNRAIESVEAGDYDHPVWARDLIREFARRYLRNLHGHLTNGEVTPTWDKYYTLSRNCRVGRGRTLGVAIAVHLMVDLPYTLHGIGSTGDQRDDFVLFGDILLEIFPQLIIDIQADYDTDVSNLLVGFFLGKAIDALTTEGTTTELMYQGIRMKAWRDSQNLRFFPRVVVAADIRTAWNMAELALAKLDYDGAL